MKIDSRSGAALLAVVLALGTTVAGIGTARADWGGHRDRDAHRMHREHRIHRDHRDFRHRFRHSREVIVMHSRAPRRYDRYRRDADIYPWLALTAATVAIINRLDQPQARTVVVPAGQRVVWVPAVPVR